MRKDKPNIIFITIDGLRAKNLSCYGYRRNTSPHIDDYAKKGVLFENFFSSYNCSHKSFFSILSGRYLNLQDFGHYPSQKEMKTFFDTGGIFLSEFLQKNGYKTHFLRKLFGWQKIGFDYYLQEDPQQKSKKWNFIRSLKKIPYLYKIGESIFYKSYILPKKFENKIRSNNGGKLATKEAIKIIKKNKNEKFFLWIHYTDTHIPYVFPSSYLKKFFPEKESPKIFEILNSGGHNKKDINILKRCWKSDETIEGIIAKYDTSILYDDYLTNKIINTLEREGLLENTIVFLFADHGDSHGEHDLYFTHCGLYDNTFHVPLIIFGGGISPGKRINSLAQAVDLTPTILDLLNINYDPLMFDGKSLIQLIKKGGDEDRIVFMEECNFGLKKKGIRTKKYKYFESSEDQYSHCNLCNTSHGPARGLYNLEKDPQEKENIASTNEILLEEMKLKMDKKIKDLNTLNETRIIKRVIQKNGK